MEVPAAHVPLPTDTTALQPVPLHSHFGTTVRGGVFPIRGSSHVSALLRRRLSWQHFCQCSWEPLWRWQFVRSSRVGIGQDTRSHRSHRLRWLGTPRTRDARSYPPSNRGAMSRLGRWGEAHLRAEPWERLPNSQWLTHQTPRLGPWRTGPRCAGRGSACGP